MRWVLAVVVLLSVLTGCAGFVVQERGTDRLLFRLRHQQAQQVALATSLDRYQPHAAALKRGGYWEVELPAHGSFSYFFLVDGAVYLPDCELREQDDFGAQNCLHLAGR